MTERTIETTPTADAATTQEHDPEQSMPETCPECDGRGITDDEHGEVACEDCGLVLDADAIDHGPEWRAFTDRQKDDRSRVGAPITNLMHDNGLSATMGWQNKDAHGNTLASKKQRRLARLRKWDRRYRTKDATERNLKQALGEIERMASALGLPTPARETAGVLYRRALEEGLLPGRSIEGMATASLYAAARQQGTPRTLTDVTKVSRVEKLRIQRAYRYMSKELRLQIEPTDPMQYIGQFASTLAVSAEAEHLARDLMETAKEEALHSGKNPAGLAAAALYAAAYLSNEEITQAEVGEAAQVSEVTIRNRYQDLLEVQAEY